MAPSTTYSSAKELFDKIGQQVHDEIVKNGEAQTYDSYLKGNLNTANGRSLEIVGTDDPCELVKEYISKVGGNSKRYPCGTRKEKVKRFSDTQGAQCDKKIEGNDRKNGDACAPFRRLNLCNKNMENMDTNNDGKAKHKLLAEVCYAAKEEGDLIKTHYTPYQQKYVNPDSQLCTVLARSFADIGDIVRGRDLFLGHKQRKKYLEERLGKMFENIRNENNEKLKSLTDDQIREYWWALNRDQVWKAITCNDDNKLASASYFRPTCSDRQGEAQAKNKCRCNDNQVPTYFDYVPQYLRWFEEWAEDFCRKKKKKVENLQKQCREKDKSGEERYCSRNGFDCEKTVNARGKVRMGKGCTDCFFACYPYVDWIENQRKQFLKQKEEFDKQKNKYTDEINGTSRSNGGGRAKRAASTENYEGYEKIFYKKLKSEYRTVDAFLGLLNNEKACTAVKDSEGGTINFKNVNSTSGRTAVGDSGTNNASQGTFYRSEYCQPCPDCGMKRKSDGSGWEKKNDKCNIKLYKPKGDATPTKIKILKSGKGHKDIEKKLNEFCAKSENGSLYEEWKCYHDVEIDGQDGVDDDDEENVQKVENAGGLCILKNDKNKKEGQSNSQNNHADIQKTYNDFFNFWVAHMLKDSIHWRTRRLRKCINDGTTMKCINGCHGKCDCFQKWIDKKKTEWNPIKDHFKKQKGFKDGGRGLSSGLFVLEWILKDEFLKEVSEDESENNSENPHEDAKETKRIKDMFDKKKQERNADASDEETIIDFMLDEEAKDATKCIKKCEEQEQESAGRSATVPSLDDPQPRPGARAETASDDIPPRPVPSNSEEEDEDLGEEDDDISEDEGEEEAESTVSQEVTEQDGSATDKTTSLDVCPIVAGVLTKENLENACPTKYVNGREKFPNWKCIPSGDKAATSGGESGAEAKRDSADSSPSGKDTGSICVPPRRRKLYIGKIKEWADKVATQESGSEASSTSGSNTQESKVPPASTSAGTSSPSNPRAGDLLTAFVESAAVETFFLWHKYKEENKPQGDGSQLLGGGLVPGVGVGNGEDEDNNPQNTLLRGDIPPPFLRQMFYTLGDYRDICVGVKDDDVIKALKASGDKNIETIKEAIDSVFNSGKNQESSRPQKNATENPESWWDKIAEHVWNGMVCALTYDTDSEEKGDRAKPKHLEEVHKKFFGENSESKDGKPGLASVPTGTAATPKGNTGTFTTQYQYNKAKLEEKNSGPNAPASPGASGEKITLLTDFISRPTYFRYLEEWGQNFCKERMKRLDQIYEDCEVDGSGKKQNPKCSCYGEHCQDNLNKDPSIVSDLECPRCGRHCSSYTKWIEKKKTEYEKQKNAYTGQKDKCQTESDNGSCVTLITSSPDAADFLEKLGPCSKTNNNVEEDNGEDKTDFRQPEETFKPATNCKPCSKFKINCKNNHCRIDSTNDRCHDKNKNSISAEDINGSTEDIDMVVSDNSGNGFNGLEACGSANIFEGFRKDIWKCGNVCGYNVCKPENVNGEKGNGNEIIIIRALFKRWLEYFLQDYNKIRKKLKPCIENGNGSTCINDYGIKHTCIKAWIEKKKTEWDKIKKHYKTHNQDDIKTFVSNLLSGLYPQTDVNKAIKPCGTLTKFEESCGLNGAESSQKSEDRKDYDLVLCLLTKLKTKIEECKKKPSGSEQCTTPPSNLEDDDEPLEETEENPVEQPKICPEPQKAEPEAQDEDACKPDVPQADVKEEEKEEKKPKGDKETEQAAPPPAAPTSTPSIPRPLPSDNTSDILKTTIPFGIALALTSIALLFLKKKTKASVGNLFQILQIPKSDYDIPTKLSPNRYIPYSSGKYRGKRYIYLEGDSGTDSGYTDHYSDITSSSESEYEELDINDIYVPHAPKYKTLIEVVLEPSGNNTTASGKNTPSDTQNDIQNDGIPSNKFSDNEWNTLKDEFISQYLQSEQPKDVPNDYRSGNSSTNTNNTTMSHHNMGEKPFITSIHDRNLYTGEEYNYNVNMVNSMDDRQYVSNNVYSGIDLINDSLNSGNQPIDIYDEVLKRKENELFGTNHVKQTSIHSVAKLTNSDPIHNQLELFHKWLDRHRDMCEQWNNKEELLDKLKEEWENDTSTSGNTHPSDSNKTLNTDVSIQIHMDNPKPINEFTYVDSNPNQVDDTYVDSNPDNSSMDTILEDLDKYNEPYYDVQDDIYYDVNDHDTSTVDSNNMDVPSKVQIEMSVKNHKLVKEKYPIADVWDI